MKKKREDATASALLLFITVIFFLIQIFYESGKGFKFKFGIADLKLQPISTNSTMNPVQNVVFEFPVVEILLTIGTEEVLHSMRNPDLEFGYEINEPIDEATIKNGAEDIRDIIIDASALLFSVKESPENNSMLMYVPLDEYYLVFSLIEEEDSCYRIDTFDIMKYNTFFEGPWVQYRTQEVVYYGGPWMTGVYTRGTAQENKHYGYIHGLPEFTVGRIRVQLWIGVVCHILKNHGDEFGFEINEPINFGKIENMFKDIQNHIINAWLLLFSVAYSKDNNSILMYVPQDEYYLVVPLERKTYDCYRIKTSYKKPIDNDFFSGKWVNAETQQEVYYCPEMTEIYTKGAAKENPHYDNIHGRQMPH